MLAVAGRVALVLGVGAFLCAGGASAVGWTRIGRRGLAAGTCCLAAAAALLAMALLRGDFSISYVADATSRSMSWPYRLGALWGGMEGSLLLFALILALESTLGAMFLGRRAVRLAGPAQVVLAVVAGVVTVTLAALSNPFDILAVPATDGAGLTPVLEHPAMLYHPPILYLGQAGLLLAFATTVAALCVGEVGAARSGDAWLILARQLTLAAWVPLSLGMLAGAHWAYRELGWGGFWAWDPVENGSLLPWLAATAFLHAGPLSRRRSAVGMGTAGMGAVGMGAVGMGTAGMGTAGMGTAGMGTVGMGTAGMGTAGGTVGRATATLALAPFCLGLLGAYLTRSGATDSVHAFGEAGGVGAALLGLLGCCVAVSAVLVARHRGSAGAGAPPRPSARELSPRETVLLATAGVLVAVAVVVLAGTLAPLAARWWGGKRAALSPGFFARLTAPLALALLGLSVVGAVLGGRGGARGGRDAQRAIRRRSGAAAAAGVGGALVGVTLGLGRPLAVVGAALATSSLVLLVRPITGRGPRRARAAAIAHAGFALLLVGVLGSTDGVEASGVLGPGDELQVGNLTLRNRGLVRVDGARRREVRVDVLVLDRGRPVDALRPGLDAYEDGTAPLPETALRSTWRRDLLVVVRRIDPGDGRIVVEAFSRPLVAWVWWGGLLVVAGGSLALYSSSPAGSAGSAPWSLRLRSSSRPSVGGGAGGPGDRRRRPGAGAPPPRGPGDRTRTGA